MATTTTIWPAAARHAVWVCEAFPGHAKHPTAAPAEHVDGATTDGVSSRATTTIHGAATSLPPASAAFAAFAAATRDATAKEAATSHARSINAKAATACARRICLH